jgi:hypothetical protein
MKEKVTRLVITMFLSFSYILNSSLVVRAEEIAETETQEELGPITAFIALVVLVVVAYFVYHLLYDNTAIIGTRSGVNYAIGRRLAIPVICGGGAAWLVVKVLNFLGGILGIIIAVGAVIVIGYAIYNYIAKRKKTNSGNDDSNAQDTASFNSDNASSNTTIEEVQNTESAIINVAREDNQKVVDVINQKKEAIVDIAGKNDNCEFGIPIQECKALQKSREAFGIPVTENVYLIHDTAVLSQWTKGFAICGTGIYSRSKEQKYLSWKAIKNMCIKKDIYLYIGENEYFVMGSKLQDMIYDLLCDIQAAL